MLNKSQIFDKHLIKFTGLVRTTFSELNIVDMNKSTLERDLTSDEIKAHIWGVRYRTVSRLLTHNLRQKVVDKFTKLSKIGFIMKCFTAGFLQFFTEKCQNLAFGWPVGYSPSIPSIPGIFLKFPNLRS